MLGLCWHNLGHHFQIDLGHSSYLAPLLLTQIICMEIVEELLLLNCQLYSIIIVVFCMVNNCDLFGVLHGDLLSSLRIDLISSC